MDTWKKIPGFEEYEINTLGYVMKDGKIMSNFITPFGITRYWSVNLSNKKKFVHNLLAYTFIPNPNNLSSVDHIDRNSLNNNLDNLRWACKSLQAVNRNMPLSITNERNISIVRERFRVLITRNRKNIYQKSFKTLEEAIEARDNFLQTIDF
jgi:hypothetical protein